MTVSAARFTGDIPRHYDEGLGPVMFAPYAADMAARVASLKPNSVLETAAGTGIVTRALRSALPSSSHLTASDLNAPMLDIAAKKFEPGDRVSFEPADAQALPFGDAQFDAVVCQFGVMFYPDKAKSFAEARRVLKKGGRYFFNVWDSREANAFARIAAEAAAAAFPADPPKFYDTPFSCSRLDPLRDLAAGAGFDGLEISLVGIESRVIDPAAFARGLVFGNPLGEEIRARGGDAKEIARGIEARLRAELGAGARPIRLNAIVFSARAA
ncbi:MAG: methyltransferase domain-containing protein [Parvularculaceae bacterium]